MVDASFGFEMETFEFLNILQAHGFPKIMGVLTHLDAFKDSKRLSKTKKKLKQRFWTEIYQGAKLFYLSGLINGKYLKNEVLNLSRFISVMKFRPLVWRNTHPYLLADRFEDLTPPEQVRLDPKCDRTICIYGYLRGTPLKQSTKVHIPGLADLSITHISSLPDPCPLPTKAPKKLNEKHLLIYAPMSNVGGILHDKDAIYITVPGTFQKTNSEIPNHERQIGERLVNSLQDTKLSIGTHQTSSMQVFMGGNFLIIIGNNVGLDSQSYKQELDSTDDISRFEDDEDLVEDNELGSDSEMDGSESLEDELDHDVSDSKNESELNQAHTGSNMVGTGEIRKGINKNESDSESVSGQDFDAEDEDDSDLEGNNDVESANDLEDQEEIVESFDGRRRRRVLEGSMKAYVPKEDSTIPFADSDSELDLKEPRFDSNDNKLEQNQDDDEIFVRKETKSYEIDTCKVEIPSSTLYDLDSTFMDDMQNYFITKKNSSPENDEETGDFEDLEIDSSEMTENAKLEIDNVFEDESEVDVEAERAKNALKKREELKDKFDDKYDVNEDADHSTYYEKLKSDLTKQAKINAEEFEGEDIEARAQFEGYRQGTYLRIVFSKIPCELSNNFNPDYPLIVGGLLTSEESMGMVQVRIKKHRWHKKILKTNDPLIFSLGWRRFQTMPVYSLNNDATRNRMLKYTPEHMHCLATFYGPITPTNTGFCCVQSVSDRKVLNW